VKSADWVITGEGKSDSQTLNGKLPMVVATAVRKYGIKAALISGDIELSSKLEKAFDAVLSVRPEGMPIQEAMHNAGPLLQNTAAIWADSKQMSKKM